MTSTAYFEDIDYEIKKILASAKESVKICVAWINGGIYTPVLQELALKGVSVEVIFNNDPTNTTYGLTPSPLYRLYPINTRLSSAIMHNKFCIVDDEIVINGSYNWSQKAGKSFENIVVTRGDYKLVKSFLHEFYDLISYYQAYFQNSLTYCNCRSHKYTLGILGYENGKYDESLVDIWSLCSKNNHVEFVGEEYEQYLQSQLGLKDAPEWDDGFNYDKSTMLNEYQQERSQTEAVYNYFKQKNGNKIHAVGFITIANINGHTKFGEDPEYIINIVWRDMFYRKIIPDVLYDDYEPYGINRIISKHV